MDFSLSNRIYKVEEYKELLTEVKFIKNNKKISYANIPCVIDIETTSFKDEKNEKYSTMYAFVLGINGKCIIGRTYDQLTFLINEISTYYGLTRDKRMIFYVHNLSYEFQFFRKWFTWEKVFSIDSRQPVYALTNIGVELRCSYLLSGYSLAKVGEHLTKYPVSKMVGDLDYSLIRHSNTPLNDKEIGYILNDGLVVMAYIQEEIEANKGIIYLPLTKTGYIRKYIKKCCLYDGKHDHNTRKYHDYRDLIDSMIITSVEEYMQLKQAFSGGHTHANAWYVGKVVENVTSYDFTSSYPSVMIAEKYPMSTGVKIDLESDEQFRYYLNNYCCIFDITFYNLKSQFLYEHILSLSKCYNLHHYEVDNGRVVSADEITTTITNVDFDSFQKFYKWDKIKISNFRYYYKSYLPTDFIKGILKLYNDKTTLKGVEGKEAEYLWSKEQLNSCYGMTVTDICRDEQEYTDIDTWSIKKCDYETTLQKYNENKQRFLFYVWGLFVTAYARRNLYTGIYACKDDYIYSDTDSIKCKNMDKHMDYINAYNNDVYNKLKRAMEHHKLSLDLIKPKTIDGEEKLIGVWDYDGFYTRFKTLGAKRYLVEYEKDGKMKKKLTMSGVTKKAVDYIKSFDDFKEGLTIPEEYTGKNTHTYIDYEQSGHITDYLGNDGVYHELSCVHMEGATYELSMSKDFINYLLILRSGGMN